MTGALGIIDFRCVNEVHFDFFVYIICMSMHILYKCLLYVYKAIIFDYHILLILATVLVR